nr:uncharacterized protein LOC124492407 [Dermatophagoides farinae]
MDHSTSQKISLNLMATTTNTIRSKMLLINYFCLIFLLLSNINPTITTMSTIGKIPVVKTPLKCLVMKNMVTNRLGRSLIENRHRMSKNNAETGKMANYILLHYNCQLINDRIRFRKRG